MATDFSISDLALPVLTEITKPYQLAENWFIRIRYKNHPRDIDKQETEVIIHWLCNYLAWCIMDYTSK